MDGSTAYATTEEVESGFRALSEDEKEVCAALLEEAAVIIDASAESAGSEAKRIVSCRMVRRAIQDGGSSSVPMGATQGTVSALGYSQSWTLQSGASGELYLSKTDKKLLGIGNRIGSHSPLEDI